MPALVIPPVVVGLVEVNQFASPVPNADVGLPNPPKRYAYGFVVAADDVPYLEATS
jgi:hypothetical protein